MKWLFTTGCFPFIRTEEETLKQMDFQEREAWKALNKSDFVDFAIHVTSWINLNQQLSVKKHSPFQWIVDGAKNR